MRRPWVALAAIIAMSTDAHAYEFWLRAQTIGQIYSLREYRLVGPDLFLGRRRFTETLALRIWDVGDLAKSRREAHLPEQGLRISWQSYLRIDHDFGDFTSGRIVTSTIRRDALDVIPELGDEVAALDLMYGYLQLDGLADDKLQIRLGRIMSDDGWGSTAYDGASGRYELPIPIAVSASAGLAVRAASPLGTSQYELDGTSGAGCEEYVEGATPGTGAWKLIDRNREITNSKLSSDYEYCPQRDVAQPTVGFSIATSRTKQFGIEVGYRRTQSDTVGLIGPVNRLDFPDLGLYPNDYGQAPATGVNEERVYARAHADFKTDELAVSPYADVRYSILNAVVDRGDVGVRLRHGDHVIEPAVEYFYPTFDGDSIFNVFSIEPTTDARINYQYNGKIRGGASGWLRKYSHDDGTSSVAGGGTASIEKPLADAWLAHIDALWDDGYGGRRVGGTGEVAWRPDLDLWLRGRQIVLGVREDDGYGFQRNLVTSSTVVSSTWRVADTVAIHGIVEEDYDALHHFQTRVIGVLDLAFLPEP